MYEYPVNDLNKCSVRNCDKHTTVIVLKKIGDGKAMFGYCSFHSIVSATFFHSPARKEIRV